MDILAKIIDGRIFMERAKNEQEHVSHDDVVMMMMMMMSSKDRLLEEPAPFHETGTNKNGLRKTSEK